MQRMINMHKQSGWELRPKGRSVLSVLIQGISRDGSWIFRIRYSEIGSLELFEPILATSLEEHFAAVLTALDSQLHFLRLAILLTLSRLSLSIFSSKNKNTCLS